MKGEEEKGAVCSHAHVKAHRAVNSDVNSDVNNAVSLFPTLLGAQTITRKGVLVLKWTISPDYLGK